MKKYSKQIERFIFYFAFCFLMFAAILMVMAALPGINTGEEAYTGDFSSTPYNEDWELFAGGEKKEIELPYRADVKPGEQMVLEKTLPLDLSGGRTLLFRTKMQDIFIYVDGQLRSSYATENFESMSYYLPSAYVACDILEGDAGKTLKVVITAKAGGNLEGVTLSHGNNGWFPIINAHIFLVTIALLTVFVAVGVMVFYAVARERLGIDRWFLYLGLFVGSLALWMLAESKLRQLIFVRPSLSTYFAYFTVEITGVFACLYFDEIQKRRFHRIYLVIEAVITLQIIINLILGLSGLVEFYQTLFLSHIWLGAGIAVSAVLFISDVVKRRVSTYLAQFVGICVLLFCCVLELLRFLTGDNWSFGLFMSIGLLVMLVSAVIQIGIDARKANALQETEKEENLMNTIEAITGAIDAKDEYTGGHSQRVGEYAGMMAREMAADYDFSEEDILRIRYIGFMHDIGKIGVADSVLNKAGKLTDEEFTLMKKHAEIGYDLLKSMGSTVEGLPEGVRHHHERFDGRGYPDGLKGTDIPLVARILCVADSYDAMTSNRVYRKRLSDEEVIEEIRRCSGKQFDPAVAAIFIRLLERGALSAKTVDGMEISSRGRVFKSALLERKMQADLHSENGTVIHASHVRMLCYIIKLAEKNSRPFDIFFVSFAGSSDDNESAREKLNQHIKKIINIRDVAIEYDETSNAVVLFDRTNEEFSSVRKEIEMIKEEGVKARIISLQEHKA